MPEEVTMTEQNQRAEKEATKEVNNQSTSEQSRDSFSREAFSQAIKDSQAAGAASAARDAAVGIAAGAAAGGAAESIGKEVAKAGGGIAHGISGKDSLPNVLVHEGAHAAKQVGEAIGKAALEGKNYSNADKNMLLNKFDDLSNQIKDGKLDASDMKYRLKDLFKPKEGVEPLATGDYLVREDGKQSLFTPNGDRITINQDGTHVIKGDVSKVSTDKAGVTTVEFGDGATVSFDRDGFLDVQRGKQAVSFGRANHIDWPNIKPVPMPEPYPHKFPNPIYDNRSKGGWGTGFDGTPGTCPPGAKCLE
jgi:hypothetical protein